MGKRKYSRTLWDDTLYVRIYDLARQGLSKKDICDHIKVSYSVFKRWVRDKPALKDALERAGKGNNVENGAIRSDTFMEYVYKQLPARLREYWDELEEINKESNPVLKVENLLHDKGKSVRQHLFLHALVSSHFNPSEACRRVNVTKDTMDRWTLEDPDFAELVGQVLWHKKNFVEGSLLKLISQGDTAATLYATKTLNRDRGYDQKTEVHITGGLVHGVVDVESLGLPIGVMRELLKATRVKSEEEPDLNPKLIESSLVEEDE